MTGDIFWKSWWAVLFISGPIFTGFLFIINSLYLNRHLPAILKALENSRQVIFYSGIFKNMGVFGRIVLVNLIGSMLAWPKLEMRVGFLDVKDVDNFPPRLLRLMKISLAIWATTMVWGGIVYISLKSR
jgi:hypothetical protein